MYYKERVKPAFTTHWEAIQKLPVPEGAKKPSEINHRNRLTREMWEKETPEIKDIVEKKVEAHYKKAMADYETLKNAPTLRSAEDYHMCVLFLSCLIYVSNHTFISCSALTESTPYIQSMADAIQERFGMTVSVFLCGPIGALGGKIEVRR